MKLFIKSIAIIGLILFPAVSLAQAPDFTLQVQALYQQVLYIQELFNQMVAKSTGNTMASSTTATSTASSTSPISLPTRTAVTGLLGAPANCQNPPAKIYATLQPLVGDMGIKDVIFSQPSAGASQALGGGSRVSSVVLSDVVAGASLHGVFRSETKGACQISDTEVKSGYMVDMFESWVAKVPAWTTYP